MYEEPYKWVEAVGNRRQYLDEQFKQGSPVVALAYDAGILLVSVSRGTPKLYEIYDRLALGGMGHPADLEKLRFNLLEMAHVEGFNRSPSDVTGGRMVKYGIAPVIKQAFEEVFKAPFIVKLLLAELGHKAGRDSFLVINYDGTFEEGSSCAVLAASKSVEQDMVCLCPPRGAGRAFLGAGVQHCAPDVGAGRSIAAEGRRRIVRGKSGRRNTRGHGSGVSLCALARQGSGKDRRVRPVGPTPPRFVEVSGVGIG